MADKPTTKIYEKVRPNIHGQQDALYNRWACDGAGRGCQRNKYRRSPKPCADCKLEDTAPAPGW